MQIAKTQQGGTLTIALDGRLDSLTSPQLESEIQGKLDGVAHLVMDLEKLAYISSAGLRVMLVAQKIMSKQGDLVLKKVCQDVREIFDVTGFSDILTIE